MILHQYAYNPAGEQTTFQVTIANGDTAEIFATKAEIEGGVLILRGLRDTLVVAFGPGAWLEVQKG